MYFFFFVIKALIEFVFLIKYFNKSENINKTTPTKKVNFSEMFYLKCDQQDLVQLPPLVAIFLHSPQTSLTSWAVYIP